VSLSVDRRGRLTNREKKKNGKSKFKSGKENSKSRGVGCRWCGEKRHIQRDFKQKNNGEAKSKERDFVYVTESNRSDALILSLAGSSESWVIDWAPLSTSSQHDIFQNYVKGELEKVYLGDNEPCDIVGKGDVMVSLSNGSTLKLGNVIHVPKLKRNLISVGQLMDGGMKTTFDGDACKITKGTMVMAHGKKVPST